MLDLMRKHASSWGIKVLLLMIIISFVLFFGYSRISTVAQPSVRGGKNQPAVAYVNHMAIPESEYRFYLDNAMDRVRAQYEGAAVPEAMQRMVQQSTLSQLIRRELLLQIADQLNITVSDIQLADAIRETQKAMRGEFDPAFYRRQYLPYFENRFGINFEDMLRNDLRAQEVQRFFAEPAPAETKDGDGTAEDETPVTIWKLEVATLDVDEMIKQDIVSSHQEALAAAQKFVDNVSSGQWRRMARTYGADVETVEGVTIAERGRKLPGYTFDDYTAIFSLNADAPVIDAPISRADNTVSVVRLIERSTGEPTRTPKADFLARWMREKAARAKIRTFLDEQSQPRK